MWRSAVTENVDVTVELHNRLSVPAEEAKHSVNDLGDEVNELDGEMAAADVTSGRFARALKALGRAARGTRNDLDSTNTSTKKLSLLSRVAGGDIGNFGDKMKKAGGGAKFFKTLIGSIKFSAFAALATIAATAVSALGAASYAAAAGLSPMVGVLGAIPAGIAGLLAVVGAVKLGIAGIGPALKVMLNAKSTAEDVAKAMAGLSPPAQAFAQELLDVKKRTDGWSAAIQGAMLPSFTDSLRRLTRIFPVVRKGLVDTGGAVGRLAESVSVVLAHSGDALQQTFARNTRIIDNGLTPALVAFVKIFRDFMVAGGPLAERFADWVGQAATNLAQLVQHGRRSGNLEDFLNRAGTLASNVGHILADVAVALFNIGKESGGLSSMMGNSIGNLAAEWRAWTETVAGKNAIRQWFDDARPAVQAFGQMLSIIGRGFAGLATNGDLAGLIRQINEQLLPAIFGLANGAAASLGPALVEAAAAFLKFQTILSFSPLADILLGIATAADGVLTVVNELPGPLKFLIATMVAFKLVMRGVGLGMIALKGPIGGLNSGFGDIRAGMQLYSEGLTGMARVSGAAKGALVGLGSAAKSLMGALGGPWGIAIMVATIGIGKFMQSQAKAKQQVDDLAASLDQQTAAITDNTRALAAQDLESSGALKLAQSLGVGLDLVTEAALGSASAIDQLNTLRLQQLHNTDPGVQLEKESQNWNELDRQLGIVTNSLGDAQDKTRRMAEATGQATGAIGAGLQAQDGYAHGVDGSADALERQANATDRTRVASIALNDTLVAQQRTLIGFRQAVANSEKTLAADTKTMNLHSQAGRDNRSALLDVAEAASAVTDQAQRTRAIKEARKYIATWADEAGFGTQQAKDYADSLFNLASQASGLPKHAEVDVKVYGVSEALASLQQVALASKRRQMDLVLGTARREGGPTWTGETFTVGEAGPEVWVGASGAVDVIGKFGREQRRFTEPGYVLTNEYYEQTVAAAPLPVAMAAPVQAASPHQPPPREPSESDGFPVPPINITMPASGHNLTEAEVEAAALRAYRRFERERKERH